MTDQLKEIQPEYPDTTLHQTVFAQDVFGKFSTTSSVPTAAPKDWIHQLQLYINGATKRIYVYDTQNNLWHYIDFTA